MHANSRTPSKATFVSVSGTSDPPSHTHAHTRTHTHTVFSHKCHHLAASPWMIYDVPQPQNRIKESAPRFHALTKPYVVALHQWAWDELSDPGRGTCILPAVRRGCPTWKSPSAHLSSLLAIFPAIFPPNAYRSTRTDGSRFTYARTRATSSRLPSSQLK